MIKYKNIVSAPSYEAFRDVLFHSHHHVALYRLPHSTDIHLIYSHKCDVLPENFEIEQLRGFIIHPFQVSEHCPALLIPPDNHYVYSTLQNNVRAISTKEDFRHRMLLSIPQETNNIETSNAERFITSSSDAVNQIIQGKIKKVVLARCHTKVYNQNIDIFSAFIDASKRHPDAMVSLLKLEDTYHFTVTPELLLQLNDKRIFKTMSLAGTKLKTSEQNLNEVTWSQKEIEEQAFVSRYIIDCFKKIRVREFEETGPQTIQAGTLFHLMTTYEVNVNQINFENFVSVMLNLLHPTSAVCGMPKFEALDIIKKSEYFDRKYFTGYIGPANISHSDINMYVNIRYCTLYKNTVTYYAGAGITAHSSPVSEYQETSHKIDFMKQLIEKHVYTSNF